MSKATSVPLILAAVLIALRLAASQVDAQAADVIADPEAYVVYASILPTTFSSGDRDLSRIALLQETRGHLTCPRGTIEPEWRSAWASYKRENARVRTFLPKFDLGLPYVLVTLADVKALLVRAGNDGKRVRGGWSEAYTRFPNGKLLAFSAVGFNESKNRAVVTVQYNCGLSRVPLALEYDCDGGQHIPLAKQAGRWVRAKIAACHWMT